VYTALVWFLVLVGTLVVPKVLQVIYGTDTPGIPRRGRHK